MLPPSRVMEDWPGLEDDLGAGKHVDFITAAGNGDVLVGKDFHRAVVGLDAERRIRRDGLDAAGMSVKTGGFAADEAGGVLCRELGVRLDGGAELFAREDGDALRRGERDAGRGFGEDGRRGEGFEGTVRLIAAIGGGVFGVDGLAEGVDLFGLGERVGFGLAGGVRQTLSGVLRGFELAGGFPGIELGGDGAL
ncbi:MAG: hypothetical protein H6R19_2947, partial [Proteobacteria bacterium]|nr:hypothetical protein [Pseudomonadota bacterium]